MSEVENPWKSLDLRAARETTLLECRHYAEATHSRMRTPAQSPIELRAPDQTDPAEGQENAREKVHETDLVKAVLRDIPATPISSIEVAAALRAEGFEELAAVIAALATRIGSTPSSAVDDLLLDHDAITSSTEEGI